MRKTGLRAFVSSIRLLLCHGGVAHAGGRAALPGRVDAEVAQRPVDRAVDVGLRGVHGDVIGDELLLVLVGPRLLHRPRAGRLGAELGDHERQLGIRGVQIVEVAGQLRQCARRAHQVGLVGVVPAEVLVDAEHVEVAEGRVGERLTEARLAVDPDQVRVVHLAHGGRSVADVGLQGRAEDAELRAVAGRLVGERPGQDGGVIHVVAHGQEGRALRRRQHAPEDRVRNLVDRRVYPVEDPEPVEHSRNAGWSG